MVQSDALSDEQLMTVVKDAGWTGADAVKAFGIALAESGGRPGATHRNTNGSTDSGIFQINSIHTALIATGDVFNPVNNARMAFSLYTGRGQKFTDWVTYNNRAYIMYQARGQAVLGTSGSGAVASNAVDKGSDVTDSGFANITDPHTWLRVALFLAGAALLLIVAVPFVMRSPVANLTPVGRIANVIGAK